MLGKESTVAVLVRIFLSSEEKHCEAEGEQMAAGLESSEQSSVDTRAGCDGLCSQKCANPGIGSEALPTATSSAAAPYTEPDTDRMQQGAGGRGYDREWQSGGMKWDAERATDLVRLRIRDEQALQLVLQSHMAIAAVVLHSELKQSQPL